ncbi:MAG: hypothetical protein IJ418_06995 [Clostridia bacterium]|nr:hypothetical protein [Clostridia bacterium]
MTRAYKITHLPEGYSKLAVAAWKSLNDRELFEIEGKLVFTDSLEDYLLENDTTGYCVDEFDSHAEFEKWLLNAVAEWIKNDPLMIEDLDQYLKLA